jgi:uncharacterized membrane protein YdbT with pleckstrin-like domain
MSEHRVVRPSLKLVAASYVLTLLVIGGAAYGLYGYLEKEFNPWHLLALLLLLIPMRKHLRTRMVSLALDNDHLTFEAGMLSRARRTVDLSKVQDVSVRQTLGGRILGIGDLTVETAGQSSAIVMQGIDSPRAVADVILQRSKDLLHLRSQGSTL